MNSNLDLENNFACNMAAFAPGQREEHIANSEQLLAAIEETRELPTGYSFKIALAGNKLLQAAAFITSERACCPYFNFSLEVEAASNYFWLSLTGPVGVKPFLLAELGDNIPGLKGV